MNNKILSIIICLFCVCQGISANGDVVITSSPYIEHPYLDSVYAEVTLNGVVLSEEYLSISLDYKTQPNVSEGWISISSLMTLTAENGTIKENIIGFGVNLDGDLKELELGKKYYLLPDTRYQFMLLFKGIPKGIKTISVDENVDGDGGFFWYNILINNPLKENNNSKYNSNPYRDE